MKEITTRMPHSAKAACAFFALVTAYVLFGDLLKHDNPIRAINSKHVMTLAVLVGVFYFGHRFWPEFRRGAVVSSLACGLLFLGGTYMCVFMAAGRNAEVIEAKTSTARKHNDDRGKVEAELARAEQEREDRKAKHKAAEDAKSEADKDVLKSCKDGKGNYCKGALAAAENAAHSLDQAETAKARADQRYYTVFGQLSTIAPARVEDADIKALSAIMAKLPWVSASAEVIEAVHKMLLPIGLALFAEIGLIVSGGIREKVVIVRKERIELAGDPPARTEPAPRLSNVISLPKPVVQPSRRVEHHRDLMALIGQQGTLPAQQFLADRWGISKSTVSDWMGEWEGEGAISRAQVGRRKEIAAG